MLINPRRSINFVLKKFNEDCYGLQLHPVFAGQTTSFDLGRYDSVKAARLKAESVMAERRDKDEECIYAGDWS